MSHDSVRVSWTGNGEAELLKTVPIAAQPGRARKVVMSFGPGRNADESLPSLKPGDRLEIGAELEVTSDASDVGRVGEPYEYAPAVELRLILARDPKATEPKRGEAVAVGAAKRIKLSHALHHGVFVFDGDTDAASIEIPREGLGWDGPVHVNAVVDASHAEAKRDQVLLIGQNEPDGSVLGDMSAICAVRHRPGSETAAAPKRTTETRLRSGRLALQGDVKSVVYSMPLAGLEEDEQLRVRADVDASAKQLGYRGRIKTRVFLADSPDQVEPMPGTVANRIASSKGQITKANGFNCLPLERKRSATKVGVVRIVERPGKALHVNVVSVAGDPDKRGRPDHLEILPTGRLTVARYSPGSLG